MRSIVPQAAICQLAFAMFWIYFCNSIVAQDGKLLDSEPITFSSVEISELAAIHPGIDSMMRLVDLESFTYLSDGLKVKGYLARPKDKRQSCSCVIYNRGGNRDFGVLNSFRAALFLAPIASWGHVVVASNYRGNGGGEGVEEFGGKDVHDVLNLFPLLESLPNADVSRVGMIGWSRGGLMTCLAMTKTDRIKAAIVGAGAFDAVRSAKDRPEMETEVYAQLIPEYAKNREEALASRSPVQWADKLNRGTPLLILHGGSDSKVNPLEALEMATRLQECKHLFRFVLFEGAEHGIREHQAEVDRISREWLDRYLGK